MSGEERPLNDQEEHREGVHAESFVGRVIAVFSRRSPGFKEGNR